MSTRPWFALGLALFLVSVSACRTVFVQEAPGEPYHMYLKVADEHRYALVYPGLQAGPAPVLIFFHGNSSNPDGEPQNSADAFRFHELWPEAIVVYAKGSKVDSTGVETEDPNLFGWTLRFPYKASLGQTKDLRYVDQVLHTVKERLQVDDERIHACGHSSGGFFTLSLTDLRPTTFRSFAVMGAYSWFKFENATTFNHYEGTWIKQLDPVTDRSPTPRPVLYLFGKNDGVFDGEFYLNGWHESEESLSRWTLNQLFIRNGVNAKSQPFPWLHEHAPYAVFSPTGEPGAVVGWRLHDQGHGWPDDASEAIVNFFKVYPVAAPD